MLQQSKGVKSGPTADLNTLLPAEILCFLFIANAFNDVGQITRQGALCGRGVNYKNMTNCRENVEAAQETKESWLLMTRTKRRPK